MLTSSCNPGLKEEGFISDWILSLASKVTRLTLITLSKPTINLPSNVESHIIEGGSKWNKLWQVFKITVKVHRQSRLDGLFSNMYDFLGVTNGIASRMLRVNSVFWYAGGIEVPLFSLTTLAFWLNTKVATCSQVEKEKYHLRHKIPLSKISAIGHGINRKRYMIAPDQRDSKYFSIGYCCRVSQTKNIETLLNAINFKFNSRKPVRLLLALSKIQQNADYYTRLLEIIDRLNKDKKIKIDILDNVNYLNNPNFYKKLDLYIHPSYQTSIDKAAVEAAFSHIPVLLSYNGFGSLFPVNSEILFKPDNAEQIRNLLQKYILSKELRLSNIRVVNEKFRHMDLEEFMGKLTRLF